MKLPPCLLPTLLALCISLSSARAQDFVNGNFESGSLSSWGYSSTGVSYSATGGNIQPGCALFGAGFATHASIFQTVKGLQPNTAYRLLAYAHLGSTGKATLWVQSYGGSQISATVTSTTTYQPLEIDFTTGSSNTSATVYFGNNSASTVYADDFSIIPASPLSDPQNLAGWKPNATFSDEFNGTSLDATKWLNKEAQWSGRAPSQFDPDNVSVSGGLAHLITRNESLLPNGNFETGDLSDWTVNGPVTITNINHPNGEPAGEAAQYTYGSKLDTGASLQQLITGLQPNTQYTLTASYKLGTGTQITINATGYGGAACTPLVLSSTESNPYNWYYNQQTKFTTGPSGTSALITVANTGAAGTVFADEVFVVPTTLPDGLPLMQGNYLTAADIESKNAPPFGYYEVRMKITDNAAFSAFWFWYASTGASDPGEELDVAEEIGNPTQNTTDGSGYPWSEIMKTTSHFTPYHGTDAPYSNPFHLGAVLADDFHVYGVDWEQDVITFYFDGQALSPTFPQLQPPAQPAVGKNQTQVMHLDWLELSTEIQAQHGIPNGTSDFQVDYVRAWTK